MKIPEIAKLPGDVFNAQVLVRAYVSFVLGGLKVVDEQTDFLILLLNINMYK